MIRPGKGFSLIELIVAVGIGGLLILVVTALVTRTFYVRRFQVEQVRTAEDARLIQEKVTDVLRNANSLDCNGDGDFEDAAEHWLQEAGDFDITVYSDGDFDGNTDRVSYALDVDTGDLSITIAQLNGCYEVGEPLTRVLGTSLVSASPHGQVGLFQYYDSGDENARILDVEEENFYPAAVVRIGLHTRIDTSERQDPGLADVLSEVVPRVSIAQAPLAPPPPPNNRRVPPTPTPLPDTCEYFRLTTRGNSGGGVEQGEDATLRWKVEDHVDPNTCEGSVVLPPGGSDNSFTGNLAEQGLSFPIGSTDINPDCSNCTSANRNFSYQMRCKDNEGNPAGIICSMGTRVNPPEASFPAPTCIVPKDEVQIGERITFSQDDDKIVYNNARWQVIRNSGAPNSRTSSKDFTTQFRDAGQATVRITARSGRSEKHTDCSVNVIPQQRTETPSVSLSAVSPKSVGEKTRLTWTTQNVQSCEAVDGPWSTRGNKNSNGGSEDSAVLNQAGLVTFRINCLGFNGAQVFDTATVEVREVPLPSVSLTADPTEVEQGQNSILTWITNSSVSSCSGLRGDSWQDSPNPRGGTHNTGALNQIKTYIYRIVCTNQQGNEDNDETRVNVVPIPDPTVTLAVNKTDFKVDELATLTWTSTNAASCTGSGPFGWAGGKNIPTGNQQVKMGSRGTYTFTINCVGRNNKSVSARQTVRVWQLQTDLQVSVNNVDFTDIQRQTITDTVQLDAGRDLFLRWILRDATSCTASFTHQCNAIGGEIDGLPPSQGRDGDEICRPPNAWQGVKAHQDGTHNERIRDLTSSQSTYTLTCSNPVESISDTVGADLNPLVWMGWEAATDSQRCFHHGVTSGTFNWNAFVDIDHATSCTQGGPNPWNKVMSGNKLFERNFTIPVTGSGGYILNCVNGTATRGHTIWSSGTGSQTAQCR